jgi:hypothetical protein
MWPMTSHSLAHSWPVLIPKVLSVIYTSLKLYHIQFRWFNRNLHYVSNLNVTQRSMIIDPVAKVVLITDCNKVCSLICNCGCMKGSYPCINKLSADTNTLWHSVEYRL